LDRVFLSAEWRNLAMINYAIDPAALAPLVPAGTELDSFHGMTYVSLVGFQFLRTRVLGISFPFHRDFEEVNLRFYVRARSPAGWRRGVVFVRELVPRWAIAFVARVFYGEPYTALPMRHTIEETPPHFRARYEWRRRGDWESLEVAGSGEPGEIAAGSLEEFITEHYWGFTNRRSASTQYEVEHPRWRIRQVAGSKVEADIASLYGARFVESLSAAPASAFLAEGSAILVRPHSPSPCAISPIPAEKPRGFVP
jgi:uncharacterized protein YqjF (DUF2071 family)